MEMEESVVLVSLCCFFAHICSRSSLLLSTDRVPRQTEEHHPNGWCSFLERVDEKDAPYMSVAVYMLYGCFTLQRKPWRSGDLFASSISNEQQAPN